MRFVQGDVFSVDLPLRSFDLVYADPPYANCRFKYARANKSRQWGRNARADYMRELIARMDALRSENGVCAVSMAMPELRLLTLFPTLARVAVWVKPYAANRPGVWPTYATEPLVMWGRFPNREEQRSAKETPKDWLMLSPAVPKGGSEHENPKPIGFGEWVASLTLGPRRGSTVELFAGTGRVSRELEFLGCEATAVDVVQWFNGHLHDAIETAEIVEG